MMVFSVPPGYRRQKPPGRPKLDPFIGIIDRIVEEDKSRQATQRHTSKRIFERLRDEHGDAGGLTIVKDYAHKRRLWQREVLYRCAMHPRLHSADAVPEGDGGHERAGRPRASCASPVIGTAVVAIRRLPRSGERVFRNNGPLHP
jgi:hypothetical protein